MLGKTYSVEQILEAQRILTTANQELADEQEALAAEQEELIIKQWDNKLHASVLEAISKAQLLFATELPPEGILCELKKRNPDLDLVPTTENDRLKVTISTK